MGSLVWLAAGPGPVKKYLVDLPNIPLTGIGKDTPITVPLQAFIADTAEAIRPHVPMLTDDAVQRLRLWMPTLGPEVIAETWPMLRERLETELDKELPILIAQAKKEMPALLEQAKAEIMPELDKVKRKAILGFGVIALMLGGLIWVRTR